VVDDVATNTPIWSDCPQEKMNRRAFCARALILGLAGTSASTMLSSCQNDTVKKSLNFANWASAETATRDNINRALQAFEMQHNVQVNNLGMPFDQMLSQLIAMTRAGISPDVVELSGSGPYTLSNMNALIDLGPFVSQHWHRDAFPHSFEAGTYKGILYAVPFSITPHGFWYNKALLYAAGLNPAQPPRTMDQLNQVMTILRDKLPSDSYPIGLDTSVTEYALVGFWPWIWTFGGNPLLQDGKGQVHINWADDGTIAAFQWLQDAIRNRWSPANMAIKDERTLMANKKLVLKLDGPYLTGDLGNVNPDFDTVGKVNQEFGVTTTPLGTSSTQPVTCADIHQLSISSLADNKDLAWKLIDFLTTSKDVIMSFLIPEGGILPYRSFTTSGLLYGRYYADTISQTFITSIIGTMRPPAFGPHYSEAALAIAGALQEIANGAGVKARLVKLTDEVKALYAQK
jgi:multiple sugar transport system substrate-binding protein